MTVDTSNRLSPEKERDFIKNLYVDMPETIQMIAKGAPLNTLLSRFKSKLQSQFSSAYCLFIVCDKDCLQWSLPYPDSINDELLASNGQFVDVPQDIVRFAATQSNPKHHDKDVQNASGWSLWTSFLNTHDFTGVSMVSVSDGRGFIHLMLVFEKHGQSLDASLMELALDSYSSWVTAAFEREKADYLLLENTHKNPDTGLLRRYSFENSFGIVLKDSRRHFQRAALLSLRLLSDAKTNTVELKQLADVIREAVRDNDLIAHYDERELVIGIRIQHLEDAEVVAEKLLASLRNPKYSNNRLIHAGFSIGIAFYPEHSSLEALYQAACFAVNSLKNTPGYRLEFHDALYESSADFYPE